MFNENSIQKIETIIKQSNQEFIQNELKPFLKIPSNTLNKEGIEKTIEFIKSYISGFTKDITVFKGEINPLLLAKVNGTSEDTLLIYMMYDTQPVNKEREWISDPFGAQVKTLSPPLDSLGKCIIARGAYNSKSPLILFLNIVKILKDHKSLPLSLLLLFDGEEEMGSPTLLKFLEKRKDLFNGCIDAYYPSMKQDIDGRSLLKLGYKGIISLTLKIFTKNKEPHSAFSAMIPNPATELISLLNTIYSNNKFLIDTLNKPYELSEEEKTLINNLINDLNIEKIKNKAGIVETIEEDPKKAFIDYLFKPTFNISTLKSGYLDEGTKNMVANQALSNIDIRFAHKISVNEIYSEIENKVNLFAKNSKSHIILTKNVGYEGSRVEKESLLVKSLIKSHDKLNVPTEIWPLSAAAAPLSKIQKSLGLNFVVGGLGIGGFAHAPNEFIQLDSIINARLSYYYFLYYYRRMLK